MKALVVYYSRTGNTKLIGEEVAAALGAEIEELKDRANRRGRTGYMRCGWDRMRKNPADLEPLAHDPASYELVVVGSPIWASTIATPVRTFLLEHGKGLKEVAWFCTYGLKGTKYAEEGFRAMTEVTGLTPLSTLSVGTEELQGDPSQAVASFVALLGTRGAKV